MKLQNVIHFVVNYSFNISLITFVLDSKNVIVVLFPEIMDKMLYNTFGDSN